MATEQQQLGLQALFQQRKELESLQEHAGWKLVQGFLATQERLRRLEMFNKRLDGLDKAFEVSFMQGEIAGLQFIKALVSILHTDLSVQIEQALEAEREEENDAST